MYRFEFYLCRDVLSHTHKVLADDEKVSVGRTVRSLEPTAPTGGKARGSRPVGIVGCLQSIGSRVQTSESAETCRLELACDSIPSQSEWPSLREQNINAGEDVRQEEPPFTAGGSINLCSHYGNQCRDSL